LYFMSTETKLSKLLHQQSNINVCYLEHTEIIKFYT